MVVAGLTQEQAKQQPIDVVIDGNAIHSRDNKTSLGADNGIRISITLALIKNRNNFKNGPIRCLFSADEDVEWLVQAR